MDIESAIGHLTFEEKSTLPPRNDAFWNAIVLGKEALERIRENRRYAQPQFERRLPTETVD